MSYSSKSIDGIRKVKSIRSNNEDVQININETGDDKGGILSGGQWEVQNSEIICGKDSEPSDNVFLYNTSNESGSTVTGATDVTDILSSDSGSITEIFKDNISGDCMLIYHNEPYYGYKLKYDSLGVVEPENIINEYLNNVGDWIDNKFMSSNANFPNQRSAWNISKYNQEQLRFGNTIVSDYVSDWDAITLNINGTNYTGYFTRFRLISPITLVPTLQQLKQRATAIELNVGGILELYGDSRGAKDIAIVESANADSDPANESVTYYTGGLNGGSAKLVDNRFSNNALSSRVYLAKIADDIDTSTSILFSIPFYVDGVSTGDIDFYIEYQQISDDFVYNDLVNPQGTINIVYPITISSDRERQILQFEIPINETTANIGGVVAVVSRDARNPNIVDTLGAGVVITGSNAQARRWRI